MKTAKLDDQVYGLMLEPGDDIHSSIESYCARYDFANAEVTGIGSVDSPTLAHYSMVTRKFTDRPFEGIFEIASFIGNVSLVDGKPFAHIHVTVSDIDMTAHSGHLVKGRCSATLELILRPFSSRYTKSDSEAVGLKVWDF
jgi:predicted DNA-binding protein with PD1-like motif